VSQRKIEKNSLKTPILGVQGHSRSSMLTLLRSSPVLAMISSTSVPICNHFHARQANSGEITFVSEGVPLFPHLVQGDPLTQRHEFLSRNTRDFRLSYGENPKSLSHVSSDWYRIVTDRQQTNGITMANTRNKLHWQLIRFRQSIQCNYAAFQFGYSLDVTKLN